MVRTFCLASVAVAALLCTPVAAQDISPARAAAFEQMLADPANRTLMATYARLSVQERDFEAAVSTLERLLDIEPDNTTARVELAIAYFALGSYAVAEYHFEAAQASGVLTAEQAVQVESYREEAVDRDDGSDVSGRLQAGYVFTDQAGDEGAMINGAIDWRIDLGDAHVTRWVTQMSFATFDPGSNSINERASARLRMGPEFRIARDAYGPRLQPYVEFGYFTNDDTVAGDFNSAAIGLAYANPLDERFTVYSDLSTGREYAINAGQSDYEVTELELGLTYRPSRDTRLRLQGAFEDRSAVGSGAGAGTDYTSASVRLSVQHAFAPDFQSLPNRWLVRGFAEFGEAERTSDAAIRTDYSEFGYGASLRAFILEDIYIETAASFLSEDASTGGATTTRDETVYSIQIGWEF